MQIQAKTTIIIISSAYYVPGLMSASLHTSLVLQAFTECLLCARPCARWFKLRKDTVSAFKEFIIPDDHHEMSITPVLQMRT